MNTYLINAPHDQKISTAEKIDTTGIHAYSNPAYYEKKSLARDFGDINEGDQIIICRNSQLKYLAVVDEVIMATAQSGGKHDGMPVKILKGHVIRQLKNISVAVFANRIVKAGLESPNLVNRVLTGFKHGAFAERLSSKQVRAGIGYQIDINKIKFNFIVRGYKFREIEDRVIKSLQNSSDEDNYLLPPWLKYPEIHPRKIFWRMGEGESHIILFDMWWKSLMGDEMSRYVKKYPNPGEWNIFCISRHKKWITKKLKNCSYCGSEINIDDKLCKFCENNAEYSGCSAKDYIAISDRVVSKIQKK